MQEPLRKISAFADSLRDKAELHKLDEDSSYELDRISDAARRMREMIDGLLQISRYVRNKPVKQHWHLSQLFQQLEQDLHEMITEHKAMLSLLNDVELWVEPTSFLQVLNNLVTNAIRYAKDYVPSVVEIDAMESGRQVIISIADNGLGLNNDYAEEIFEPFKRLVGRTVQGHGLGLAICKQIVTAHDGRIWVESELGKGSTFYIALSKGSEEHEND